MVINARCRDRGSITAEVVNLRDEVFPGFRVKNAIYSRAMMSGTFFLGKAILSSHLSLSYKALYPSPEFERYRKFRFYMDNVELYSMTVN